MRRAFCYRRPVWCGNPNVLLHALALEPLQLTGDLEPGAVIRSIAGKNDGLGVFLDSAADWGFDTLPFAYDWRADAASPRGISPGGCARAKAPSSVSSLAARVRLFRQMGTPSRRSASAYRTLQKGDIFGPAELLRDVLLRAWPAGKDRWFEYRDSLLSMTRHLPASATIRCLDPQDETPLLALRH